MENANEDKPQSPAAREATEMSNLVDGIIEDFLAEAERDLTVNQSPVPEQVALIELAAAAIARLALTEYGTYGFNRAFDLTKRRSLRMLLDVVDAAVVSEKTRPAHLRLVK
jgi:hypothetical protein